RRMEVGDSRLVARWHHLHRRNVQGACEAHVREGRVGEGSKETLQLEPRGEHTARDRHSRGREGQRGCVQGAHQGGSRGQQDRKEEVKMNRRDFVAIVALWPAGCAIFQPKPLYGTWDPVNATFGGRDMPVTSFVGARLVLKEGTYEFGNDSGTIALVAPG